MVMNSDHILLLLVISSTLMAFLVFLVVLGVKFYYVEKEKHIKKLTKVLESCFVDYLLGKEDEEQRAFGRIKKLALSKTNRNIMIELLLNLNHNFSGFYADKAYDLYEELELHKMSLKKLKDRRWHAKIRGMYELSSLEYEEAFDEIAKYINHKHDDVKRNARVSLVKVKKKEALLTLKDLEGSMSQWTFINIIATLKRTPIKLSEEELNVLRNAKNTYVQALAAELENTVYVQ